MPVPNESALILLLGIGLAAFLLLFWKPLFIVTTRSLLKPVATVFRKLSKPMVRVLYSLRIISQAPPKSQSALAVGSIVALTAGTVNRAASGGTETDQAIADNFEKKGLIIRHGRGLCTWLAAVTDDNVHYDRAQAETDQTKAKHFFSTKVPIGSDPLNFYEDIEGAFIVKMFKDSDKPCFYTLSEFRKTINGNVLKLTVLFSVIVSLVAIMNMVWSKDVHFYTTFHLIDTGSLPTTFHLFGFPFKTEEFVDKFIFGIVSCLIAYLLMWLFYHTQYAQYQRNNGQQLNQYLIAYLARINIAFNEITAHAAQTVLQEKEVDMMRRDTEMWITNLQWMAFRVFFVECFLRNALFQIHRNCSYYVLLIPMFFVFALLFTMHASSIEQLNIFSFKSDIYHLNSFYLAFPALLVACYGYLKGSLSFIWQSIEKCRWSKFYELNVHGSMSKTLDAYVDQLDRWRGVMKSRA